jgi:hypothetical protein
MLFKKDSGIFTEDCFIHLRTHDENSFSAYKDPVLDGLDTAIMHPQEFRLFYAYLFSILQERPLTSALRMFGQTYDGTYSSIEDWADTFLDIAEDCLDPEIYFDYKQNPLKFVDKMKDVILSLQTISGDVSVFLFVPGADDDSSKTDYLRIFADKSDYLRIIADKIDYLRIFANKSDYKRLFNVQKHKAVRANGFDKTKGKNVIN